MKKNLIILIALTLASVLHIYVYSNAILYFIALGCVGAILSRGTKEVTAEVEELQPMPTPEAASLELLETHEVSSTIPNEAVASVTQFDTSSWRNLIRNAKDGGANSILATEVLKKTSVTMKSGEGRVGELVASNQLITKRVKELQDIANDIDGISSMSHMVSINASVEAQRAGEHGRTFQVVASEIGDLAKRVKSLTVDISNKLSEVLESVEKNTKTCGSVSELFRSTNTELDEFAKIMLRVEELSTSQEAQLKRFEEKSNP